MFFVFPKILLIFTIVRGILWDSFLENPNDQNQ